MQLVQALSHRLWHVVMLHGIASLIYRQSWEYTRLVSFCATVLMSPGLWIERDRLTAGRQRLDFMLPAPDVEQHSLWCLPEVKQDNEPFLYQMKFCWLSRTLLKNQKILIRQKIMLLRD